MSLIDEAELNRKKQNENHALQAFIFKTNLPGANQILKTFANFS